MAQQNKAKARQYFSMTQPWCPKKPSIFFTPGGFPSRLRIRRPAPPVAPTAPAPEREVRAPEIRTERAAAEPAPRKSLAEADETFERTCGAWGCSTRCPSSALLFFLLLLFLFGEGSPTKIDYRNKSGTLILTSLLEDLVEFGIRTPWCFATKKVGQHGGRGSGAVGSFLRISKMTSPLPQTNPHQEPPRTDGTTSSPRKIHQSCFFLWEETPCSSKFWSSQRTKFMSLLKGEPPLFVRSGLSRSQRCSSAHFSLKLELEVTACFLLGLRLLS